MRQISHFEQSCEHDRQCYGLLDEEWALRLRVIYHTFKLPFTITPKNIMFTCTLNILLLQVTGLAFASPAYLRKRDPSWKSLEPIPLFPRQEHTTVFLPPSTIAILGGVIPNASYAVPMITTPLMQFYSIPDNTWSTKAAMPQALNHPNVAVVNGKLYLLGGLAEDRPDQPALRAWTAVTDSWEYDPSTGSWSKLADMPSGEARGTAAVGVYASKIYLAGGMTHLDLRPNGRTLTSSVVSIYDTVSGAWLEVPPQAKHLPEVRDHAGAAVIGSKMYVLGGRYIGQGGLRGTVYVLDLCDLAAGWKTAAGMMPTPRGGLAAGVVGNKVYTFGGEGNNATESGVFGQVEVYDTVEDQWASAGTMALPRHGTFAVGVEGKVYIPGGGLRRAGGSPTDAFDVFTF
ncbi:kelch domain-containing protein [Massariosphaeria phaeospora]|uniref:Kelch domain-containing protein n=1 Tax=Massariosphaeria phaeospora TaxID=100035 RepID=A0A7C8MGM5_9PLEO|nr:kelch domain-containing protein [Massariosphaeria phaeospora]